MINPEDIKPGDDVTVRGMVIERVGDHVQIGGGKGLGAWELTVAAEDIATHDAKLKPEVGFYARTSTGNRGRIVFMEDGTAMMKMDDGSFCLNAAHLLRDVASPVHAVSCGDTVISIGDPGKGKFIPRVGE